MTEYSFVDMHIHTSYSDEALCDLTIEQLLEKTQTLAERLGGDCVISITDHNSILGVKKAHEILSKVGKIKYPNVRLINGIEFTTDLVELSDLFEGNRFFTRCHTLAYGYNENDKELTAYSRVAHKLFPNDGNVGMQICAARRIVSEKFNLTIPFSEFEFMADLDDSAPFKQLFIQKVLEYAKQKKFNIKKDDIEKAVSEYILDYVDYVREASSVGRLKVSEIAKLVKDAGGELVLAHPALLKINVNGLKYIAKQEGITVDALYVSSSEKYNNNTDIAHLKNKKLVLSYFLNAFEKVCGYKVSGMEKFYHANFKTRVDQAIEELCKERGMYETCGSDYHGEHLHPDKSIGCAIHRTVQEIYKQQFDVKIADFSPMFISAITAVDHLMGERTKKLENKAIIKLSNGTVVPPQNFETAVSIFAKSPQTKVSEVKVGSLNFEQRIADLIEIVKRFNVILSKADSPRAQAKLMLRLNLFAENIIEGLQKIKFKTANNDYLRTLDVYKQIVDLMSEKGFDSRLPSPIS